MNGIKKKEVSPAKNAAGVLAYFKSGTWKKACSRRAKGESPNSGRPVLDKKQIPGPHSFFLQAAAVAVQAQLYFLQAG